MAERQRHGGLRLIQGGLERRFAIGPVAVLASPRGRAPFPLDARVEEQDRWLILGAEETVRRAAATYRARLPDLRRFHPARPGSVVVRGGRPVRLLAVVHDVAREPTWSEAWILRALDGILRLSEIRGYRALALPLLGGSAGLPAETFAALLQGALARTKPRRLARIWLMLPEGQRADRLGL